MSKCARLLSVVLSACGVCAVARADAQTNSHPPPLEAAFDDADGEPPVVSNRARPLHGAVEISLMFVPTVIEKYTQHFGGVGILSYHVNNVFALEVMGGYEYMRESAIIGGDSGVRSRLDGRAEPHLPDLLGMSWLALGGFTLAPIYGKINLFSEVDLNSQAYLIVSGGAVGAVKRELVTTNDANNDLLTTIANHGVRPAVDVGVGVRLFTARWFALRAEIRDIVYWNNADLGNGAEFDLIHNFMGVFGVSFVVN